MHTPGMGNIDASFIQDVDGRTYAIWKRDGNGAQPPVPTPVFVQEVTHGGTLLVGEPHVAAQVREAAVYVKCRVFMGWRLVVWRKWTDYTLSSTTILIWNVYCVCMAVETGNSRCTFVDCRTHVECVYVCVWDGNPKRHI